jgi:cytidine deaminase, homotetrameric
MKERVITTTVSVYNISELDNEKLKLCDSALEIAKSAYSPYSKFNVGAAVLLANNVIITGNNQENAAYPSGLCAERVALFYAGAQYPNVAIKAIAIAAIVDGKQVEHISPCGACRQVLLEAEQRNDQPIKVILCGSKTIEIIDSAATLLPVSFELTAQTTE